MNDNGLRHSKKEWVCPYVHSVGPLSLSGTAVAIIAQDTLVQEKEFRFAAPGTSMSPFIQDGDIVTLTPLSGAICSLGDIVAFALPDDGRLVIHRIVKVVGDRCMTKGDNNPVVDGLLPLDFIIGRVSKVERSGRIVQFGLGPERTLIALLSQHRLLPRCMQAARAVYSAMRRLS